MVYSVLVLESGLRTKNKHSTGTGFGACWSARVKIHTGTYSRGLIHRYGIPVATRVRTRVLTPVSMVACMSHTVLYWTHLKYKPGNLQHGTMLWLQRNRGTQPGTWNACHGMGTIECMPAGSRDAGTQGPGTREPLEPCEPANLAKPWQSALIMHSCSSCTHTIA